MTTLIYRDAQTGQEIDRITAVGDELAYHTGMAADVMRQLGVLTGMGGEALLATAAGWSNGAVTLQEAKQQAVTAAARIMACLPPRVPRPQPGPCPGIGTPGRRLPKAGGKTKAVPRARPQAVPAPGGGGLGPGVGGGREGVRTSLLLAEDIDEVNAVARAKAKALTGRDIPFDLGGIDVDIAREHAEGILRGLERFPGAKLRSVGTFDSKNGRYAGKGYNNSLAITEQGPTSRILFNTVFTNDPAAYRLALRDSSHGHFAVPTAIGIALHEFGHVLEQDTQAATASKKIASSMAATIGSKPSKLIEGQVSFYAKKSNGELLAEGISDVMAHGERASPVSAAIFAEVARRYDAQQAAAGGPKKKKARA